MSFKEKKLLWEDVKIYAKDNSSLYEKLNLSKDNIDLAFNDNLTFEGDTITREIYRSKIVEYLNVQNIENELFKYYFMTNSLNREKKDNEKERVIISKELFNVKCDISDRHTAPYSGAAIKGDKVAQIYIQNNFNEFIENNGFYTMLFTGVITPYECNVGESWELIEYRRDSFISLLKEKIPDLYFIVSAIEEHTGSHSSKKKEKKESTVSEDPQPEEESEEEILTQTPPENKDEVKGLVYKVHKESKIKEIISLFTQRNEQLKVSLAKSKKEVYSRIVTYLKNMESFKPYTQYQEYFDKVLALEDINLSNITEDMFYYLYDYLGQTYGFKSEDSVEKKNLEGYAHLHLVLFFKTKNGKKILPSKISNICLENKIFLDIDTRDKDVYQIDNKNKGKTKSKTLEKNPLSYCLKNNRHRNAFIKLGFKNPCKLYNWNEDKSVNKFFADLLEVPSVKILLDGVEKLDIVKPIEKVEFKQSIIGKSNSNHKDEYIPVAKSGQDLMINYVNSYLRENNMAFGGDGNIYKKVLGSRNTYTVFKVESDAEELVPCNYKLFLAELTSTSEGRSIFPKYQSDYIFHAEKPNQKVFDKILVNCEWIEFKDFYVHIPTKKIIKNQTDWAAFCFISNLTFSDFEKVQKFELLPTKWIKILINSNYTDKDGKPINDIKEEYVMEKPAILNNIIVTIPTSFSFTKKGQNLINDLYRLLAPKVHKSKVPVLFGPPDCAKTTLISPFISLLPPSKIGTCGSSNGFESSNFVNKLLMIMDEASMKSLGLNRSQLLTFLEGNTVTNINDKHKDPTTKRINTNIIIAGNNLKWAEKQIESHYESTFVPETRLEIDSAYATRCNFYPMNSIPFDQREIGVKEYIERKEKGLVFLYLLAHSNESNIEIVENIDEMREIIDNFRLKKELTVY